MELRKKLLSNALLLTTALSTKVCAMDYAIDVKNGAIMHCQKEEEYFINNKISAYSNSRIIFEKPATINSQGTLKINGQSLKSEGEIDINIKFNDGLTVDNGSLLANGYDWKCDVSDRLVLIGDVTFGQKNSWDGIINILSDTQNSVFDVSELGKITLPEKIPMENSEGFTIAGDGNTQLQYVTDKTLVSLRNLNTFTEEKNKNAVITTIRDKLDGILDQPFNVIRMKIQDYEASNVDANSVRVNVNGKTGEVSAHLEGFETILTDELKAKCINKGLNISAVEIDSDVMEALGRAISEKISELADIGKQATIIDFPPIPVSISTTDESGNPKDKVELNFNISSINDGSEGRPTQTFSVQFNFPAPQPGDGVKDNKVEINGKVAKNIIIALYGNANAVEIKPENMTRIDFSSLVDQIIKFILRSSTQSFQNSRELRGLLRDGGADNIVEINEDTFVLGNKNLHFETGKGNIINFVCKDQNNPFTPKIIEYIVGKNSITNIGSGVTLSI